MDNDKDDKTIFEKIGDAVKSVMDTAAAAATKAMEPDPVKANGQALVGDAAIAPEAIPAVAEYHDAHRMTAEEIAEHAAADTQPVIAAKKSTKKKAASPNLSGRITPVYDIPIPDTPLPTPKKAAKKASKNPAKKAVKKSKTKKAVKKTVAKKSKKAVKKIMKKSSKKKKAKRG